MATESNNAVTAPRPFVVYVNDPRGQHLCGYLVPNPTGRAPMRVSPWGDDAQRFASLDDAHTVINQLGIERDESMRTGRLTAYAARAERGQ